MLQKLRARVLSPVSIGRILGPSHKHLPIPCLPTRVFTHLQAIERFRPRPTVDRCWYPGEDWPNRTAPASSSVHPWLGANSQDTRTRCQNTASHQSRRSSLRAFADTDRNRCYDWHRHSHSSHRFASIGRKRLLEVHGKSKELGGRHTVLRSSLHRNRSDQRRGV